MTTSKASRPVRGHSRGEAVMGLLRQWPFVLGILAVLAGVAWAVCAALVGPGRWSGKDQAGSVQQWIDTYADVPITIGTFLIAALLGLASAHRAWLESLPLRLTVAFTYEGQVQLIVVDAPLTDVGNAREWSQALIRNAPVMGAMSKHPGNLPLDAFKIEPQLATARISGLLVRRVLVRYALTESLTVQTHSTSLTGLTGLPGLATFDEQKLHIDYQQADAQTCQEEWTQRGGESWWNGIGS